MFGDDIAICGWCLVVSYEDTLTYLMTAGRFLLLLNIVTVGRGVIVACSAVDKILSV